MSGATRCRCVQRAICADQHGDDLKARPGSPLTNGRCSDNSIAKKVVFHLETAGLPLGVSETSHLRKNWSFERWNDWRNPWKPQSEQQIPACDEWKWPNTMVRLMFPLSGHAFPLITERRSLG